MDPKQDNTQPQSIKEYYKQITSSKKMTAAVLICIVLFLIAAGTTLYGGATATDALGVQAVYDKFIAIANDKYVVGIVAIFLVIIGIKTMVQSIMMGFFFFGLAIAVMKLQSIVDALTSAVIPM